MFTDQFRLRRHFASTSFYAIVVTLFFCLIVPLVAPETLAGNINAVMPLLQPIMVCLTGLVAHYGYMVQKADAKS